MWDCYILCIFARYFNLKTDMSCILYIETATSVCSVAASKDGKIIIKREETAGPSHATVLGSFVKEVVDELQKQNLKPDAIAVSCGPGSYTGLRIGVSEAKGLCYGWNIPLIAIETLTVMAARVLRQGLVANDVLLCPMIDARRMEVYDAIFDSNLNKVKEVSADIIDENSFQEYLSEKKIVFFGDGSDKCKSALTNSNALFIDSIYPHAEDMVLLAEKALAEKSFADVAYFEPFYLKEFVATTPKNKVLSAL